MVFRLVRQLAALAVAVTLVCLVTGRLGTSLAAHSLSGYVASYDAALSGDTARADSLANDLSTQWHSLAGSVASAWSSVESTLEQLAPQR
jgi:hypothetical protein